MSNYLNNGLIAGYALAKGVINKTSVDTSSVQITYTGKEFNAAIKQLVNSSATVNTEDTTITNFEKTNTLPDESAKQVQLATTEDDLIAYLDGTVIKLYTTADKIVLPSDSSYMFQYFRGLTSLDASGNFDTSKVTNMHSIFSGCINLTSLNVSSFDTNSVVDMENMFGSCYNLTSLDVSSFDTSSVITMDSMFSGCSGLKELNLGNNFDTNSVTDMDYMFSNCSGLTSLDLGSKFVVNNVTNYYYIFHSCTATIYASSDTATIMNTWSNKSGYYGQGYVTAKSYD